MTPNTPIDPNALVFAAGLQYGVARDTGFTVRAELASRIMVGLCANPAMVDRGSGEPWIAEEAVKMADILITVLNKTP